MNRERIILLLIFICNDCFIFPAISAIAGLAGLFMQHQATRAAAKQAEYDAEYEAQVAENQAEQEKLNIAEQEKIERKQTARRRAAQRASYAKSGVLLEGTPLTMLSEQAGVDEQNIQQGNLESRQRQANIRSGGKAALQSGKNRSSAIRQAGNINLLTSVGQVGMQGYKDYKWWERNG